MHVEFRFHGTLREAAGRDRLERDLTLSDGATVGDALAAVLPEVPAVEPLALDSKGTLRAHVALRRNGEDVRSGEWLETPVAEDDRIDLEPSVKGAC
ncbi:MAG: ubiquitin-like small modifier protein 1 [Haloarculaceae archaeon]|jgi:molybdopterin converting factor small subunit